MNDGDMPISTTESLKKEDFSKPGNKGDSYSQKGNFGIGNTSDCKIKGNAKVAGKIEENNNNQSQKIVNNQTIHNHLQNDSKIKVSYENEHEKIQIEADNIETLKMCFDFLAKRYDPSMKVQDIEKSSIKFILKGSEEGLKNIANSFKSGELAPLLKQQFNLELEDAKLIESDSSENYRINQSQKLLAFTIAGNVSQAHIDILKAALINTPDNEEIKNEEKSRLVEEIRTQGARGGKLKLRDTDLSGAYLRGVNLIAADLTSVNLIAADLTNANLSRTYLNGAYLTNANLSRAYLNGVYLTNANLSGADLSGANLIGADLSGANLIDTDLSGAYLRGAHLSGADLTSADLTSADLTSANLRGADLTSADLTSADLTSANLRGADLTSADLTSANLRGANLRGANLRGADLSGANLRGADLTSADLTNANLSCADLSGANLRGAELIGTNTNSANLKGIKIIGTDLRGAELSAFNLSYADLSGADLSGADLSYADLSGTDLSGAYLRYANLSCADLSGTKLRYADVKNTCFWNTLGLSESLKKNLIARGAIFEPPPPRDYSRVLTTA